MLVFYEFDDAPASQHHSSSPNLGRIEVGEASEDCLLRSVASPSLTSHKLGEGIPSARSSYTMALGPAGRYPALW
jgi:hypothetical protein